MSDAVPGPDLQRRFTVEEANGALPEIRRTLEQMRRARRTLLRSSERIKQHAGRDGGGEVGREHWEAVHELRRGTEWLSVQGILLRDIDDGLIDFPAEREGGPIFLCWKLGEPEVRFWHPVDTGFSGRRPL